MVVDNSNRMVIELGPELKRENCAALRARALNFKGWVKHQAGDKLLKAPTGAKTESQDLDRG